MKKKELKIIICCIVIFLCLINFYFLTKEVINKQVSYKDIIGYNLIAKYLINDKLTPFVKFITHFGGSIIFGIIIITSLLFIKNKKIGISMLINLLLITIINVVFKNIITRPRPVGFRLINEKGYSFPSGHSMISLAFYGFIIFLIYKFVKNKYLKWCLILFLSILIICIGISRVYLGVHYTTDVLAGYLLSLAYLIIFCSLINKFISDFK